MGGFERLCEAGKLVHRLERRVDEDDAAPLGRRHIGIERGPTIDRDRLGAAVPPRLWASAAAAVGSSSQAIRRSWLRKSDRASTGDPG